MLEAFNKLKKLTDLNGTFDATNISCKSVDLDSEVQGHSVEILLERSDVFTPMIGVGVIVH